MKLAKSILLTGLLVGTLDGIAAIINFKLNGGGSPVVISKYIASAAFGPSAFQGGAGMVLSGIIFHYTIALIWTAFFFLIFWRVGAAIRVNKYILGVIYGVLIWTVMNLVVVPLSNAPPARGDVMADLVGIAILVIAVGIPISLIQRSRLVS